MMNPKILWASGKFMTYSFLMLGLGLEIWGLLVFKLRHKLFFNYKYLHESTTFWIEHEKSWVVYKHLQNVTLEMKKPTKLSKFHMWNFLEIRSGYMWVAKFGWFKWVSKRLRLHCCDNCDIVFVKVELLWKIVGANTRCAQVH
jgi:hypothetical protein